MKTIIRAFVVAAALACAAGTAEAQTAAPDSSRSGVHLGLSLNGSALRTSYAHGTRWELTPGLGLHAGYEYAPGASVFVRAGATSVAGEYGVSHADLGLRLSLGESGSTLRPFVQAAVGTRGVALEGASSRARGFAFTAGGGLEYFVSRTLAVEGGLSLSAVRANSSVVANSRLDVGLSWHP
jgi:opacity protein-like surface antigen